MPPPKIKLSFDFDTKISKLLAIMAVPSYNEGSTGESEESYIAKSESGSFFVRLFKELVGVYYCRCRNSEARKGNMRKKGPVILPDLVCCHVPSVNPETIDQHQLHDRIPTNTSEMPTDQFCDPLSVKMSISYTYTQVGGSLRKIADQFGKEQKRRRIRHRHPAGNHHHTTKTIQFTLQFILPISLLGLSIALLRRKF